jgi:cobyrinic acid a,c-diamide synthase
MVGGISSGCGKTTVATGIMAALSTRGIKVASAKVGPDYIDPGYHALATGRPGRNLDVWMCGHGAMAPLAAKAQQGADLLVIEGVMGLFDGIGATNAASSAELAAELRAPVVLVVDAGGIGASVAPLVRGYRDQRDDVAVTAVVLNQVGSDRHEAVLREALAGISMPVLGAIRRNEVPQWKSRHLGLKTVAEGKNEAMQSIRLLADVVERRVDLEALVALARSAPLLRVPSLPRATPSGRAELAVAHGAAFSFYYQDNLERLEEAGATLCYFDPANDEHLPPSACALYVGGGFPELYAAKLASNIRLAEEVRWRLGAGMPAWAECGGLLWLCREMDGHPLVGALAASGRMTSTLELGYREATLRQDCPIATTGTVLRGHEFHYSKVDPAGSALMVTTPATAQTGSPLTGECQAEGRARVGHFAAGHLCGFASPSLFASYLHLHLGADPRPAERFVRVASSKTAPTEAGFLSIPEDVHG